MKMNRGLILGLLSVVLVAGSARMSIADGQPVCQQKHSTGFCLVWVSSPQSAGTSPEVDAASSHRGADTRECRSAVDVVPCSTAMGSWDGGKSCYVRVAAPQPEDFMPLSNGREGGVVMECTYPGADAPAFQFWVATADAAAAPDPRILAQTAIDRMDLQAIRIGSFPHTVEKSSMSLGVVGWNVWMWVDGATVTTYGPVNKSASAGGYTVTATAQVTEVVWDMGNGDTVTCGKGTPYPATVDKDPVSPDCGYRYTHDGRYRITATTHWNISWSGIGQSGVIPMELIATGNVAIAEIQVLNVPVEQQ